MELKKWWSCPSSWGLISNQGHPSVPQEQLVRLQRLWGLGIRTADGLGRKLVSFQENGGLWQCSGQLPLLSLDKKRALCRLHNGRALPKCFLDRRVRSDVPRFPQTDYAGIVWAFHWLTESGSGPGPGWFLIISPLFRGLKLRLGWAAQPTCRV